MIPYRLPRTRLAGSARELPFAICGCDERNPNGGAGLVLHCETKPKYKERRIGSLLIEKRSHLIDTEHILGNYSVTASAPGFKSVVQSNIELRVADRKTVDIKLELGSPMETVTVSAEAVLIDTSSASVGTTINKEAISNLPLMGRNPFSLVQYSAGVVYGSGRASSGQRPFDNGGMDNININGGGNQRNEILLDGVTNTNNSDSGNNTFISFVPPPDAVSEFKVQSNSYDSEYGHSAGGVVSLSLKSGTNGYHGSAYWYLRNDALNANDTSANAAGTPLSAFRWNQPGFQVDGPVRIPKIYNGSDKTFFMYNYELIRSSIPRVSNMVVPTELERKGDFSQTYVSGTSGPCVAIYDPLTTVPSGSAYACTAFPNCQIPANRINPIAAKLVSYYPLPNITGVARGVTNLTAAPNPTTDAYDTHTIRIDQNISNNNRFFASFVRNNRHEDGGLGGARTAFIAIGKPNAAPTYRHWRTNHGATLNLTTTISPTFVNTAKSPTCSQAKMQSPRRQKRLSSIRDRYCQDTGKIQSQRYGILQQAGFVKWIGARVA